MKKFLFIASLLASWLSFSPMYAQNVAKIGSTEYATLQEAVTAAQQAGGAQTINLIGNVSEATVTIQEVANFQLTVDGQNKTVDAVIVVDGLRGNGGSTTNGASVTLQNIAFVKTTATDGIQATHYPHHLTIQNCTYSGYDNDKWFLNASVDGPLYGVTVKKVTVENARLIYANLADDAVFQNITATNDIKVGFNVKTSGTALIENCQVTTGKYAFRDYSDGYEGSFTLKDNTFISTSTASDEGVIVNRGGADGTASINVVSGTYTGRVTVLNGKTALNITGGTFTADVTDYLPEGYSLVNNNGVYTVFEGNPPVAKINDTYYGSLAEAVAAATAGQKVKVIAAGTYTLPSLPNNITLEGDVDGVVFNHTTAGNIASVPNGATFKNVTFNFGNVDYHGFQHAGTINMEDCTLNGKFFSYGNMNFTNCQFVHSGDYNMWVYGAGEVVYDQCTFTNTGKMLHLYCENSSLEHKVTVNDCTFINNASAANKAAINVKATSGANLLAYDVTVNNCTTEGAFPAASSSDALIVLNELIQVDDRPASGVDNITITQDGALAYPAAVAQIGDVTYPSLQAAIDAAYGMTGNVTIELIDDIEGYYIVKQKAGLNLTIDGAEKTVAGQIIIDGDGGSTRTETLDIKNIKFEGNTSNFCSGTDAFILVPSTNTAGTPYYNNSSNNYSHNVTISDCSFTSTSTGLNIVAIKTSSGGGNCYNLVVESVTGTNLHSLAQLTGSEGVNSITNCVVGNSDSFVNISGGTGTFSISGNTFTSSVDDGYGIRENSGSSCVITLTDNNFTAAAAVKLGKGGSATNGTINIVSGTYVGDIVKDIAATATGKIVISGGKFSAPLGNEAYAEFIAENFIGMNNIYSDEATPNGVVSSDKVMMHTAVNGKVTFYDAIPSAFSSSGTYQLLKDVTRTTRMTPGIMASDITLDLNGHTLTSTATDYAILLSRAGTESSHKTFALIDSSENGGGKLIVNSAANAAIQATGKYNDITIGENVTIDGGCVAVLSENQTLIVNGTINGGNDFAVAANGSSTKNTTITINEGAVLTSNVTAVYLPGNEGVSATINGGTITGGDAGIEVRAGQLIVNAGEITSTATTFSYTANGNGTTTKGAAIAVVQHTTVLPIDAQILGGTLTGVNQIAVVDAQNNNLEGISLIAKDELAATTNIPEGYKWVSNGDGTSSLAPCVYVAQIGDVKYESLQDALDAAEAADPANIVIDLLADATLDITARANVLSIGTENTQSITINGNNHTLTFNQKNSDWNDVSTANDAVTKLILNDMAITNSGHNDGPWNRHDINFSCDVTLNNVTSDKALAFKNGATLNNVTITETGSVYGIWIQPNGQDVSINGLTITAERGIKVDDQYVENNPALVNLDVQNATFNTTKKAAILVKSGANTVITIGENVNIENVAADNTNVVWVDEDRAADYYKVTTTGATMAPEGGESAYVACLVRGEQTRGYYATFAAAYASADYAEGDTYKLHKSTTESVEVAKVLTIVKNGCTAANITAAEGFKKNETEEQITFVTFNPVCEIAGGEQYETLEAAFAAAQDGETITLLADCTGNGIKVPQGKFTTGLTVDFGGFTYTVDGATVGSTGTQTQAFQLLKDNKITFQNGTIYSEKAKILVQNYSDLTLEGMTLTMNNENYTSAYTLSNNNGNVVIDGTTINANPAGGFAFDVCRYSSYPSVSVTVQGESVINGDIEIYASGSNAKDGFGLALNGGTMTGNIVLDATTIAAMEATPEKVSITKADAFDVAAPEGYKWVSDGNGTSTLALKVYLAQIGDVKYESLAEAVAAVPAEGTQTTITMIDNEMINVVGSAITIPATKNVVIDLNGYQVVGTAEGGSTSALITNRGTLTIMDSSDTNADGTGTGKLISGATTTWIYDGSGNYSGSYASNTITNSGTLNVESGYIENLSTGSATYAVDNNSSGGNAILNMNGGLLKAHSVAVREFANSTTLENTVNVNGGTIEAGYSAIWIQLPGSDASKAMKAALNVTGGTLTGGSYAFYDYSYGNAFTNTQFNLDGGTFNGDIFSYGANINITDGTYNGDIAIKQSKPSTVAVSGGTFAGDIYAYGDNASEAFITGGQFATITYEYEGETYDCDWIYCLAEDCSYEYSEETGMYEIIHVEAQVGDVKYETFAEAAEEANGEVITLLANIEDAYTIAVDEILMVKLNDHTLTVNAPAGYTVSSTVADDVTTYSVPMTERDVVLTDGQPYTFNADTQVKTASYVRNVSKADVYCAWYVPFDYTIPADETDLTFYRINLIANSPEQGGEVEGTDQIWIYLSKMNPGEKLTANRPYVFKSATTGELTFTVENATLYAPVTSSRLDNSTTAYRYDFYGTYASTTFAVSAATPGTYLYYVNGNGQISKQSAKDLTLGSYRWYIRATQKEGGPNYAPVFVFVDDNDDATGISQMDNMMAEESYYNLNGMRINKPARGAYIIKYKDGSVKKIMK